MRQRRWLELIKDYDMMINNTPRKANVAADALSRKSTDSVLLDREIPKEPRKEIEQAQIKLLVGEATGSIATMRIMEELKTNLKN